MKEFIARVTWDPRWILGWLIIGAVALSYELIALGFELVGFHAFPTLSTILVTLVPLWVLDAATTIVFILLIWHWHDLHRRRTNDG